jgi:ribosomal protein S18 acetylase RimI-like enzyme
MGEGDQATIVQASHKHLPTLAPLFDAYRVFYDRPSDIEAAHAYLLKRISRLEAVIFLAMSEDGREGLGFVQLYPSFSSLSLKRIWILYDLFVIPWARRQGIGRALMERAREFAQAAGAGHLELSTEKDNLPAQVLYESLGYVRDNEAYYYQLAL